VLDETGSKLAISLGDLSLFIGGGKKVGGGNARVIGRIEGLGGLPVCARQWSVAAGGMMIARWPLAPAPPHVEWMAHAFVYNSRCRH
jgi:hypothetical protein